MAKKEKYKELSDSIIDLIGGKDNITFFTHCMTRLRFNIKDKSLVKKEEIDKINGVIGSQWAGEQLQLIIGQDVDDAYKLICTSHNLSFGDKTEVSEKKQKLTIKSICLKIADSVSGCIVPLIPALIACGMIKVLVIVLPILGLLEITSPTYVTLSFIGDAAFYFLPIYIGATAADKFGANRFLGMALGAILVMPTFTNGVTNGETFSFIGIPIYSTSYANTFFPVIISVFIMSYVEKFFAKYSPSVIRSITEPFCTFMIMAPLTLCLIGPAGTYLGTYVAEGAMWLYEHLGFILVGLLSALMPYLTLTGLGQILFAGCYANFFTMGYEPFFIVSMFISNFNQGAASLAVALKTKDKNLRATGIAAGISAIVGGVTEPALYGINMKYKKPLIGAIIGGLVAGCFCGLMNVYMYQMGGSSGIFGFTCFIGPVATNLIYFIIGSLLGVVVTFASTLILFKDEGKEELL